MVRIVGGNAYLIFQRFLTKLCTVAHCPAAVGHPIAIDEMTRIDQHNLATHITCLSFWKQRCFYFFDWPKKRSDDPSRSMAFRLRPCLELFPRTPLHRLASVANSDYKLRYHLKLNFPCFTLQVMWFQGQAKHFDREETLESRMNLSSRRGASSERSNWECPSTIAVKATSCLL